MFNSGWRTNREDICILVGINDGQLTKMNEKGSSETERHVNKGGRALRGRNHRF